MTVNLLSKSKDLIAPLSHLCYCIFVKFPYSKLYGKLQFQELWGWSWRRGQGSSQPHPVLGKRMIYNGPQHWQVTCWVKHFLYHLKLLQFKNIFCSILNCFKQGCALALSSWTNLNNLMHIWNGLEEGLVTENRTISILPSVMTWHCSPVPGVASRSS